MTLTVLTILLFALASLLFAISAGLLLIASNRLRKATHMLKEIDEIMQDIQFALHKKAKITNELQKFEKPIIVEDNENKYVIMPMRGIKE